MLNKCYLDLPDAVTLGEAYKWKWSFSSTSTGSRDMLQWVVGWQQQEQDKLLMLSLQHNGPS